MRLQASLLMLSIVLASAQVIGPGAPAMKTSPPLAVRPALATAGGGGGQTQTDNFNRADSNDIGANWTVVTSDNPLAITSQTVTRQVGLEGSDAAERYSGVTWTDNQSSEAAIVGQTGVGTGAGYGVIVRASSSARTFYRLVINADGGWELGRRVAGTYTTMATGTTTYSAGAILKLSAVGTTITSTYNGSQIDSRTDSNIASGSPGITYSSTSTGSIDDWTGIDGL